MKRTSNLLIAALILAGCASTATVTAQDIAPSITPSEPTTSSEPESASTATAGDAEDTSPLSTPVLTDSELDLEDVSIETTTYSLTLDQGTDWEIPLIIAAPTGWAFDSGLLGFSDGASSIGLAAGCAGECEIKGWSNALNADGEFFDAGGQLFASGASFGFHQGTSSRVEISSAYATNDDGSGSSLTAHTRNDVGRFVGCTAIAAPESVQLDQLRELCQTVQLDWSIAAANTPEYVVTEQLTEETAAAVSNPAPGLDRQSIAIDGEGLISIALPPGSTVNEDGDEIELADATSIFTDLELDAACDGACGPQDWNTKLQEFENVIGRTRLQLDLIDDSPIEGGWVLTGSDGDDYIVLVARWNDQSERYFSCTASIDERDLDLIDDMLNICLSAEPDWSTW